MVLEVNCCSRGDLGTNGHERAARNNYRQRRLISRQTAREKDHETCRSDPLRCSRLILLRTGARWAPSGRGSITGDPAASSANPRAGTTGSNPSGSGTSASGGKDDNRDQGRDKMPESNMTVRPAPGKPDIPSPVGR